MFQILTQYTLHSRPSRPGSFSVGTGTTASKVNLRSLQRWVQLTSVSTIRGTAEEDMIGIQFYTLVLTALACLH